MIIMCHDMKWTYDMYMRQPSWFIVALQVKMNVDARFQKFEMERAKRRSK